MTADPFADLPAGQWGTIVADPPWDAPIDERLGGRGRRRRAAAGDHYPTLTPAEIRALPVGDLAAPSAWCFLWVTNRVLARADHIAILTRWGFRPVTLLTWVKTGRVGLGAYFRGSTEHAVLGVRGYRTAPRVGWPATHFAAPRGAHSEKPGRFYDLVTDAGAPGPYLELFQRQGRLGWTGWGYGHQLPPTQETARAQ